MDQRRIFWWAGPRGGLGNRLLAIAAVRACAIDTEVKFMWNEDNGCPGKYEDVLEPIPFFTLLTEPPRQSNALTHLSWNPLEIFDELSGLFGLSMGMNEFSTRFIAALKTSPFKPQLVSAAKDWRACFGSHKVIGIHIRRTDRIKHHQAALRSKQGGNSVLYVKKQLPFFQSLLYRFGSDRLIGDLENIELYRRIAPKILSPDWRLATFSDDEREKKRFTKGWQWSQPNKVTVFGLSKTSEITTNATSTRRKTSLRDAAIELLCLSRCDAIAQNNSASTFSLVASIIGSKPILTTKTHHDFWRRIEDVSKTSPNDKIWNSQIAQV